MPVIFRPARPSRRVTGGRKGYVPGIGSLRITTGAAAGISTVTGVGVAIKSAIGSTAGAAAVTGAGVAIKAVVGSAAGIASVSGAASGLQNIVGVAAGVATVTGAKVERVVTSTRIIQKPVDYALAGQQLERQRLGKRALHHAFGE